MLKLKIQIVSEDVNLKDKLISKVSIIVLLLLAFLCAGIIEYYIYKSKQKYREDIYTVQERAFEDIGENNVIDCCFPPNSMDDFEFEKSSLPDIPTNDKHLKKYWQKRLSDIESFYEIKDYVWQLRGLRQDVVFVNDSGYGEFGVQDYILCPKYVGVKCGSIADFDEMHDLVQKCFKKFPIESEKYNHIHEKYLTYTNKYYRVIGHLTSCEGKNVPPQSGLLQVEPVYFNNQFSGEYNYRVIDTEKYRVYFSMRKSVGWSPDLMEDEVIKSRCIYYALFVLPLLIASVLILIVLKRKKRKTNSEYMKDIENSGTAY